MSRLVEVGIGSAERAAALIRVAQRYAGKQAVCYSGLDWFDARSNEFEPLTLKQAYRTIHPTGAQVRLVPGAPGKSLSASANAHLKTDLLLISASVTDAELEASWFYVPRMLHETSLILRECFDAQGGRSYARLTVAQVAQWAAAAGGRRAA
jgi:hypothetical protein